MYSNLIQKPQDYRYKSPQKGETLLNTEGKSSKLSGSVQVRRPSAYIISESQRDATKKQL